MVRLLANKVNFIDNSSRAKSAISEAMAEGLKAALLIVEALAPVDNGELRDSLNHTKEKSDDGLMGYVGTSLMYAIYVEFGTGEFAKNGAGRKGGWYYQSPDGKWHYTKGMEAQPFLLPAFRRTKKNVETVLGLKLRKVGGKG